MLELLDYVLDYNDNFWIVGYIDNEFKGYIVYQVDDRSDRYNNITRKYYKKCACHKFEKIPAYKKVFKPNKFYLENKGNLTGVWKKYVEALNKIGIEDKDIGIFGSYLVGFDVIKDIDFAIYGENNLIKYYENNEFIKDYTNSTYINDKHKIHQYNKHKDDYHIYTDLLEIVSRNWSGIQINEKVLSTPRFINRNYQHIPPDNDIRKKITFEVLDGFKTAMLPRQAKVLYNNEEYTVLSCLWKYQSFLRKGDVVETIASINEDLKTIILVDHDCYVKYIEKGKEIK